MFRQSLRRCASRAAATSLRSLPRAAPVLGRTAAASTIRPIVSSRLSSLPARAARCYSTEATEATEDAADEQSTENTTPEGEDVLFESLQDLGVHPNLLKAIVQDMGYATMTPVQAKTIKPALSGSDIVAQAKTGTGKTLAFLLPLLQRMINDDPSLADRRAVGTAKASDIRGIILSPTRELAEQIAEEARRVCAHTGLVVQSAVGGTQKSQMLRQTQRKGCHLLVATPGRLNDILSDPRSGIDAPGLSALVLDEADRMLDAGFEAELNAILDNLPDPQQMTRQTLLVSATIPDNVIRLARSMVRADDFQFVQTIGANESLTHDRVPQRVVATNSWANLFPTLFELIDREVEAAEAVGDRPFKAIVYFNTTAMVQLAGVFGQERRRSGAMKIPTIAINSKLTQGQREKAASMFKSLRSGVLFSSDVTARGMDFPNVTHVIQIDTPGDRETYIHRLGRTARQNKEGEGWLLLPPQTVRFARQTLEGLPVEPDTSLESATADVREPVTQHQQEMKSLGEWVHKEMIKGAYSSLFGGFKGDKIELVDDLNDFVTYTLGMSEIPSFSPQWVSKMGLSNSGISIDNSRFSSRPDRGGRGDRGYRQGDSFRDAFDGQVRGHDDRGRGRSDRGYGRRSGGSSSRYGGQDQW